MEAIAQLDTRQKVILVITVVMFAFVAYYGYETFFADSSGSETVTATAPVPAATPSSAPAPTSASMPANSAAPSQNANAANASASQATMDVIPPTQPSPEQQALLKQSQAVQQEYLRLVNEYQLIQLRQKVEQANAEMAQARLISAQTLAQINELNAKLREQNLPTATPTQGKTDLQKEQEDFQKLKLMYVGKQLGHWVAMLNSNGAYLEVKIGTRLPDGSLVSHIDQRGITITKAGNRYSLTIPKGLD